MNGHTLESVDNLPASYFFDIAIMMASRGDLLIDEEEKKPEKNISRQAAYALPMSSLPDNHWLKQTIKEDVNNDDS
jgi:hypothetical protein